MKHGKGLVPLVRLGFAVYQRGDTMVLVAAPRKTHVNSGSTIDARSQAGHLVFRSPAEIKEADVASVVKAV
ncbi:MAG: hypothetical protein ACYDDF_08020 [Thermoplasmatota archaeon]